MVEVTLPHVIVETALSVARDELESLRIFSEDMGIEFGAAEDYARMQAIDAQIEARQDGRVSLSAEDIQMMKFLVLEWKEDRSLPIISVDHIDY